LSTLISDLGDGSSNSLQPIGQTIPITIQSVNQNGAAVGGLYTKVESTNGAVLATGFTPLTYNAAPGSQLQVTVDNYGGYTFYQWSTGSTGATVSVTAAQSTTLTAYFQDSSAVQYNQEISLAIDTVNQNGAPINGLYAVIQ